MKKKWLGVLLVLILMVCGSGAFAETTKDAGIWEARAYVDEFDMPTNEYYISNAEPIIGKFSNSATTDSLLGVYLYVDVNDKTVSIKLIEYGNMVVKNAYYRSQEYDVVMMDPNGSKHYLNGEMLSGSNCIYIEENDKVLSALNGEGTVRFAISEKDYPVTKYIFSIEDTSGLKNCLKQGEELIGYKVIWNDEIRDGMVCVNKTLHGGWGAVDITGDLVIPIEYDEGFNFREGRAMVVKDGQVGYIDTSGNEVIPFQYRNNNITLMTLIMGKFSEGLATVWLDDGKWGYIDTTGEVAIPCTFDWAYEFSEGLAAVEKDGKMGFIDAEGNDVIPYQYDCPGFFDDVCFSEGMVSVKRDGKWGYINLEGDVVIPFQYDEACGFREGMALVSKDDKWGYIDREGNVAISCQYDDALNFAEGMAWVKKSGMYGCINTDGKEIILCQYDDARPFSSGYACVKKNRKWGVVDTAGKLVISCMYDEIAYGEGHLILLNDGALTAISCEEL